MPNYTEATVSLLFDDKPAKQVKVTYTRAKNPLTNLDRIDKAVYKAFPEGAEDGDWSRWNLVDIGY